MKKMILPALFIGAISLTSCTKDWDCTCTIEDASGSSQQISYPIEDVKKSEAKEECDVYATGGGASWECKID